MLSSLYLGLILAVSSQGGLNTKASAVDTKPIAGSKILSSAYPIAEGTASQFLVTNMMKLENAVTGFENMEKPQIAAMDKVIKAVVSGSLDLNHLAERSLIAYWEELGKTAKGKSQREQYRKLFIRLVEENYLEKARQYISGKYQILFMEEAASKNQVLVRGKILKSDVDLLVEFRMIRKPDGFRVVDVQLDETSLEGTYRSSFNRIIRKQGGLQKGFPELIRVMEKRLAELKKGTATKI